MKKLLVLTLVLSVASLATAALQLNAYYLDLTPYDGADLAPSDELIITVTTDADIPLGSSLNYIVVSDVANGTLGGGAAVDLGNAGHSNAINGLTVDFPAVIPPAGMEGLFAGYANFDFTTFAPIAANTVLLDAIIFHCESPEDATVAIYEAADGVPSTNLIDAIVINQVPEPATMALLGLGALVLRRRK